MWATTVKVGDTILLRARTGKRIIVEEGAMHAKFDHSGTWQRFVVEKA